MCSAREDAPSRPWGWRCYGTGAWWRGWRWRVEPWNRGLHGSRPSSRPKRLGSSSLRFAPSSSRCLPAPRCSRRREGSDESRGLEGRGGSPATRRLPLHPAIDAASATVKHFRNRGILFPPGFAPAHGRGRSSSSRWNTREPCACSTTPGRRAPSPSAATVAILDPTAARDRRSCLEKSGRSSSRRPTKATSLGRNTRRTWLCWRRTPRRTETTVDGAHLGRARPSFRASSSVDAAASA